MRLVAVLVALLLLPCLVSPAMAGIEPSPFQPELRRLNAIIHCLSELQQRVGEAASEPVTPMGVEPSPFRAAANQLNAAANQLRVLSGHLEDVLAALVGQRDAEVGNALLEIDSGAQRIVDATGVDNGPEELEAAMLNVHNAALAIVDLIPRPPES